MNEIVCVAFNHAHTYVVLKNYHPIKLSSSTIRKFTIGACHFRFTFVYMYIRFWASVFFALLVRIFDFISLFFLIAYSSHIMHMVYRFNSAFFHMKLHSHNFFFFIQTKVKMKKTYFFSFTLIGWYEFLSTVLELNCCSLLAAKFQTETLSFNKKTLYETNKITYRKRERDT